MFGVTQRYGSPSALEGCMSLISNSNTFVIPEILHDPTLILSPHEFLLGILFDNNAFWAPSIKTNEDLRRLWLENGQ